MQVAANPEKTTAVIAVGTLQNLAAESNANKEAIREAGGIPILVSLIKRCPDTAVRPLSLDHASTISTLLSTTGSSIQHIVGRALCCRSKR